jgi:Rrf2 family transcriptional regulator, nitric oxide-sensitive transcriptional repressor
VFFLYKKDFDFAIRICSYLAGNKKNKPIPVSEISKKLLITKPYTTKIIYLLRKGNIVSSTQGKNGGIFLKKNPKSIFLLDILNCMGLTETVSECITEEHFCPLPAPCKIHSYFMNIENKLLDELKKKKLSQFSFSDSDFKLNY